MSIKEQFGKNLKEKVLNKDSTESIGSWIYSIYFEYMGYIDQDFERLLLKLSTMEEGAQFARSYEELHSIADRLIAGEDVVL